MTGTWIVAVAVMVLGVILGAWYGALALSALRRMRRVPELAGVEAGAGVDRPTRRFRGEEFERTWQGSRGYEQVQQPVSSAVMTDRLMLATFTLLRPSRFGDPAYWSRYLPGVLVLRGLLFFVAPLALALIVPATVGSTFTPSAAQTHTPPTVATVAQPTGCGGVTGTAGTPVAITYADGGTVFRIRPGHPVEVTYLYGAPTYSPGAPLCPSASGGPSGPVRLTAGRPGTGYLYLPQPTGTVVVKVVVEDSYAGLPAPVFYLAVLAGLVLVADVVLTVALRRATRRRYT